MTPPYDHHALNRLMETQTGLLNGFTTDHDRTRFPYVVVLQGLSPGALGYRVFYHLLHRCVRAAVEFAPLAFRFDAYYEDHQRAGYQFRFARRITAIRFSLRYNAALSTVPVKIAGPKMMA